MHSERHKLSRKEDILCLQSNPSEIQKGQSLATRSPFQQGMITEKTHPGISLRRSW